MKAWWLLLLSVSWQAALMDGGVLGDRAGGPILATFVVALGLAVLDI